MDRRGQLNIRQWEETVSAQWDAIPNVLISAPNVEQVDKKRLVIDLQGLTEIIVTMKSMD